MRSRKLAVALSSLVAEGTPVLALELCRVWLRKGLRPELFLLSGDRADLLPEVRALGLAPRVLELGSGRGRFLRMAREAARACHELGAPSLISFPLGWHAFLALGARWAGAKRVIAHVGNYPPFWTGLAFDKFRFQVQLGRPVTDALVCCSDYVRDGVIKHFGVAPNETITVYNGCPVEDVERRAAVTRARRTASPFRCGMVARLEVHKDQPTLIHAAALLKERGLPIEVWLIGEGSRREEYVSLIRSLGVEREVKLLGMRRDVPELLGQLDAFVFSAKRDEGFGVALVEAMAAGTPVIATDVGACREVLQQGRLGRLVPEKNPSALADALAALAAAPADARALSNLAQQHAREFTVEAMADRYAELVGF